MRLTLTIDDIQVHEAVALLKEILSPEQADTLLGAFATKVAVENDFGPSTETIEKLIKAFDRVKMDTFALLGEVMEERNLDGDIYRDSYDIIMTYDIFQDQSDDTKIERMISNKVGGLNKITRSIDCPSVASVERSLDERFVEVKAWVKPLIISYLSKRKNKWADFLDKREIITDPLDIVN